MDFASISDPGSVSEEVQSYWREVDAYQASKSDADETISFLDGPPNPSGQTHLGTIWNKVLKDVVVRHARMSGYSVTDRPGYDTHLFTTEQQVRSELGLSTPADVSTEGVEEFESACEEYENRHIDQLEADFESFGVWLDWDQAYRTDSQEYADKAWWVFKQLYETDAVETKTQVAHWCPTCERSLYKRSEVANEHLPNQEAPTVSTSPIYVEFPLQESAAIVTKVESAWHLLTTAFLTVDPDRTYRRVSLDTGEEIYVAEANAEEVFLNEPNLTASDSERVTGDFFEGLTYEHPLLDRLHRYSGPGRSGRIYADSREAATGFGHGTPAIDESDRRFAERHDLKIRDPVRDDGTLDETYGVLAGTRIEHGRSEITSEILDRLNDRGALVRRGKPRRRTNQCWACGGAILPRLTNQWYISLEGEESALRRAVSSVDWSPSAVEETMSSPSSWHPDWSRDPRFEDDPDANHDWLIQQEAYWGLPLPVWTATGDNEDEIVVGSRRELAERADQEVSASELDPRRSTLDDITITEDSRTYQRVSAVFADRYSAALAALAVTGLPDQEQFEDRWPVDLIIEAKDQPGIWFFMQLAFGVSAFGEMPFDRAFVHGFLTDDSGDKMSKSVGNIITPSEAIDRYGVDALRAYFVANTKPATDLSVDWTEIESMERRLQRILDAYETARRLRESVRLDADTDSMSSTLGDWIERRLQRAATDAAEAVGELEFDRAVSGLMQVVEESIVETYVPLLELVADDRGGLSEETIETMDQILRDAAKLLAPYAPHCAEYMYQSSDGAHVTVHAAELPFDLSPADGWRTESRTHDEPVVGSEDARY